MDINATSNLLTQMQADILASDPADANAFLIDNPPLEGEMIVRGMTEYEAKFFGYVCRRAEETRKVIERVADEPCNHAEDEICPGAEAVAKANEHYELITKLFWNTVKEREGIWAFHSYAVRKGGVIVKKREKSGLDIFFDAIDSIRKKAHRGERSQA